MSRLLRLFLLVLVGALVASADTGLPTVGRAISATTLTSANPTASYDLRDYFSIPGTTGTIAQFVTTSGTFNVELLTGDAPQHVVNFSNYANAGAYNNTIIHRSAILSGSSRSIVQGGGYLAGLPLVHVATNAPVPLEYKVANARGTLAAARTNDLNSATSEWYFNVQDNTSILGPANSGGYTVFGRVIGTGLSVVDAIAAVPVYNGGTGTAFETIPLRNYTSGQPVLISNFVTINTIRLVPFFPTTAGQPAVATFSATSSNPVIAAAAVEGSQLSVTGIAAGTSRITVRAMDSNGNAAETSFDVTVTGLAAPVGPTFAATPTGFTLPAGMSAALLASATGTPAPTYQWRKNGTPIAGATQAQLLFSPLTAADAGDYTVDAINSGGTTTSPAARVAVAATGASALANLSVRAAIVANSTLMVGFSSSGDKNILVRGIGPGLAQFGLSGVFADPRLELYRAVGQSNLLVNQNEDWPSSLSSVFNQVSAFALPPGSKDTALQHTINGAYSAMLKGAGAGIVLVEAYDAGTNQPTRLGNLSARYVSGTGDNVLIAGFTVSGDVAKTVLIRGVGPRLAEWGVANVLADPKLSLYRRVGSDNVLVAENDNWSTVVTPAARAVYAFDLDVGSKDAALLITLPPGLYSAQVSGAGNTTGEALVEVYDVP